MQKKHSGKVGAIALPVALIAAAVGVLLWMLTGAQGYRAADWTDTDGQRYYRNLVTHQAFAADVDWDGSDGALLFRISADHKRFRTLTVGKTVILGHKTLDTFPGGKPLKDRRNIVLSHRDLDVPGAEIAHSFDEAAALGGDDAIVIGGASVYMALLSRCDRVYVTKVDADPDADSFFPNLDDNPDWRIESESETFEENGLKFRYVDYVRK